MPDLQDIPVALTCRIFHEEDFTFPKKKEELALTIRLQYLPKIRDLWSLASARVSMDTDGDIQIESERGKLFVMQEGVILTGLVRTLGSIIEGHDTAVISAVLDELFASRRPLQASRYDVRMFVSLQFVEDFPVELMWHSYFEKIITEISPEISPSGLEALRWQMRYSAQEFADSVDVTITRGLFELRYNREGKGEQFASSREFLAAANLTDIANRMRPLIEPLLADPTKIRSLP